MVLLFYVNVQTEMGQSVRPNEVKVTKKLRKLHVNIL